MREDQVHQEEAPGIQGNDPDRVGKADDAVVRAAQLHAQGGGAGGGAQHLRGDGADDGKTQPGEGAAHDGHEGDHDREHGHAGAEGTDAAGLDSGLGVFLGEADDGAGLHGVLDKDICLHAHGQDGGDHHGPEHGTVGDLQVAFVCHGINKHGMVHAPFIQSQGEVRFDPPGQGHALAGGGNGAYRPPFSSSLRTALSMTEAALVQSSSLVCSGSQWDRPFSEGAKIMVVGIM